MSWHTPPPILSPVAADIWKRTSAFLFEVTKNDFIGSFYASSDSCDDFYRYVVSKLQRHVLGVLENSSVPDTVVLSTLFGRYESVTRML
jgi:hypothetical protein